MQAQFLHLEDPLEEEMATHSSILAWRIPWTEEPGGLQSTGLQRVGHDWPQSSKHPNARTFFSVLSPEPFSFPCEPFGRRKSWNQGCGNWEPFQVFTCVQTNTDSLPARLLDDVLNFSYTYTCTHSRAHHTHACTFIDTHTHRHDSTQTHLHTHTHTHTRTHTFLFQSAALSFTPTLYFSAGCRNSWPSCVSGTGWCSRSSSPWAAPSVICPSPARLFWGTSLERSHILTPQSQSIYFSILGGLLGIYLIPALHPSSGGPAPRVFSSDPALVILLEIQHPSGWRCQCSFFKTKL